MLLAAPFFFQSKFGPSGVFIAHLPATLQLPPYSLSLDLVSDVEHRSLEGLEAPSIWDPAHSHSHDTTHFPSWGSPARTSTSPPSSIR